MSNEQRYRAALETVKIQLEQMGIEGQVLDGIDAALGDQPAWHSPSPSRMIGYIKPTGEGKAVEVDLEGIMTDLVTFIKAMAINRMVDLPEAKLRLFAAMEEVWDRVEIRLNEETVTKN